MSQDDNANPADVAEQMQEVGPEDVERPTDSVRELPDDAAEGDVLEQHHEVPVADDEDEEL